MSDQYQLELIEQCFRQCKNLCFLELISILTAAMFRIDPIYALPIGRLKDVRSITILFSLNER